MIVWDELNLLIQKKQENTMTGNQTKRCISLERPQLWSQQSNLSNQKQSMTRDLVYFVKENIGTTNAQSILHSSNDWTV